MTFTFYFPLLPPTQRRQHPKAESKFYGFKRKKRAAFKHDLQLMYQPHEGATFRGTYRRMFDMLQTTNERFIIAVESTNPLAQMLIQISSCVLDLCHWKIQCSSCTGMEWHNSTNGWLYWLLALGRAWYRRICTGRLQLWFHDREVHCLSVPRRQLFLRSEYQGASYSSSCIRITG